jgi:hypothetical protein
MPGTLDKQPAIVSFDKDHRLLDKIGMLIQVLEKRAETRTTSKNMYKHNTHKATETFDKLSLSSNQPFQSFSIPKH